MYSLSLNRAGRDFSERERDRLGQYQHLVHSAWLRVEEAEAIQSVLGSLYDLRDDVAMLVLTPSQVTPRVAYCTEAMQRLLSNQIGLWDAVRRVATSVDQGGSRTTALASLGLRITSVHTGDAVVVHVVPAGMPSLTHREQEVLAALASGHTAGAIGRRLAISERTVRKHLENLYTKIGVHDRLGAVTFARRTGLN